MGVLCFSDHLIGLVRCQGFIRTGEVAFRLVFGPWKCIGTMMKPFPYYGEFSCSLLLVAIQPFQKIHVHIYEPHSSRFG
jgi:hypothetical protein